MSMKHIIILITIAFCGITLYVACNQFLLDEVASLGPSPPPPPPPLVCPTGYIEITDRQGLEDITLDKSGDYCLTADIDLFSSIWVPIGNQTNPFRGNLDGTNHTITGLTINQPTVIQVGLFSWLGSLASPGGTIKNLIISGASVTGKTYVGPLVGRNVGTIENVHVQGGTISAESRIGGLAGSNNNSILKSSSNATVNGTSGGGVGGLVGLAFAGPIDGSYATGNVTGKNSNIGGIAGFTSGATIRDSYATGSVRATASGNVGGIAGFLGGGSTLDNVYATGSVINPTNSGGLVGSVSSGTITSSYFDIAGTARANAIGSGTPTGTPVGVSSGANIEFRSGNYYDNMGTPSTADDVVIFIGWDFATLWSFVTANWPIFQ